jgi:choice-of-anchor B domain-containing protein
MADTKRLCVALGLALLGIPPLSGAASAPVIVAAHEDEEWHSDRQPPYDGSGWSESQGESPQVDFPSSGIDLRSWLSVTDFDAFATAANDCWGYVSASGREYALVGLSLGTGFVDVTDPGNAQIIDVFPGPISSWRDIKTYLHYAYAVSEAGGGIQVFDLSQIDSGVISLVNSVTTGGRSATHNIAINTESGMLYRVGGGGNNPPLGLRIYSLAEPGLPVFVGEWNGRYCHDAQVVTWDEAPYEGVEVAFCYANDTSGSGNPGIEILDVSDPENVATIGSINLSLGQTSPYPAAYSHQGWLSPDRQYIYFDDEVDEQVVEGRTTTTRIIDVSDLSNPVQAGAFSNGNTARDHNLYTLGELIFAANYSSGLRVFDAAEPLTPFEFAFFDTYPEDDDVRYNGLWNVYPYLPSGTILGSDIEKGLFVWTLPEPAPPLLAVTALATLAWLRHRQSAKARAVTGSTSGKGRPARLG